VEVLRKIFVPDFIAVCQQSTEFHFPPIEDQLDKIRVGIKESAQWRQARWGNENLSMNQAQVSIDGFQGWSGKTRSKRLEIRGFSYETSG